MDAAVNVISIRSQPVSYYLRPATLWRSLWGHRDLIRQLTWRNVLIRYRGSILGVLWSFLLPLLMLAVYTFVFGVVFQSRWPGRKTASIGEFALTLYAGLVVYTLFSETLNAAPQLIVGNPNYVKRVVFPLEILPLCSLGAALFQACIGIVALLACEVVFTGGLSRTVYWFPAVLLPLLMLTLGLAWFLASLGVYVRDAGQIIGIVLQVLMFLSPIFYSIEQVPAGFQAAMRLNPLTVIVVNARNTLLWGQPPEWIWLVATGAGSFVVMQLGYVWFMKTRRGFADVL
ncbi:MAG: ABC transporter permease [Phycisphaerae bacterium]